MKIINQKFEGSRNGLIVERERERERERLLLPTRLKANQASDLSVFQFNSQCGKSAVNFFTADFCFQKFGRP